MVNHGMQYGRLDCDHVTYFVVDGYVPARHELPWNDDECDAFVAIFDPARLVNALADKFDLEELVSLRIDWIDTMGPTAERLHDLIDSASVTVGRQGYVGEGDPMTAWHEELTDPKAMIEFIRLGGLGSSGNKLIIAFGSADVVTEFFNGLKCLCGERSK